jgi:predicted metal-dependent peptidase
MKNDKILKAKSSLILDQPFFASILLAMPINIDNTVPTMATDGLSILYNEQWVNSLSLNEVVFVLAHETLHCVFQHMTRRGSKNPNKYNIAADYVINDVLVKDRTGKMPKGGLLNSVLVKRGNGTTDGVYALLPKETETKSAGQDGGALDQVKDAGTIPQDASGKPTTGSAPCPVDGATIAQNESIIRVRVIQAKNAAKAMGKLSPGLERLVDSLTKTKTDWTAILRRFFTEKLKLDFSYARPKRRFLGEDIILPSLVGEKLGTIAIAIDCSGSVDAKMLKYLGDEVNTIFQDARPTEIKIIYFDSKVLLVDTIADESEIVLKALGGGGTAFSPIFKEVSIWESMPIALVVLTDLACDDFGPAPEYPVLWASTYLEKAPFGEVMTIGEK